MSNKKYLVEIEEGKPYTIIEELRFEEGKTFVATTVKQEVTDEKSIGRETLYQWQEIGTNNKKYGVII